MHGHGLRILIADDDARLAALVSDTLDRDSRFDVVGRAESGQDAVRLCAELAPDLVLMDISMPGLDGIEATRLIHEHDARLHVVIYTGSDEYDDIERAHNAGAAGYLHKDALTSPDLPDALSVLHRNHNARLDDL